MWRDLFILKPFVWPTQWFYEESTKKVWALHSWIEKSGVQRENPFPYPNVLSCVILGPASSATIIKHRRNIWEVWKGGIWGKSVCMYLGLACGVRESKSWWGAINIYRWRERRDGMSECKFSLIASDSSYEPHRSLADLRSSSVRPVLICRLVADRRTRGILVRRYTLGSVPCTKWTR